MCLFLKASGRALSFDQFIDKSHNGKAKANSCQHQGQKDLAHAKGFEWLCVVGLVIGHREIHGVKLPAEDYAGFLECNILVAFKTLVTELLFRCACSDISLNVLMLLKLSAIFLYISAFQEE